MPRTARAGIARQVARRCRPSPGTGRLPEVDGVRTFCTDSSRACGAERRGDPRRGPRAAVGAGAPSSRTPPPPRFYTNRAAPGLSAALSMAGSPIRGKNSGAKTWEAPSRRRSGTVPRRTTAHVERYMTETARVADFLTRRLRGTFVSRQVRVNAQTRVVGRGTRSSHLFAHLFPAERARIVRILSDPVPNETCAFATGLAQTTRTSKRARPKQAVRGSSPLASSVLNLAEEDVAALDRYVQAAGVPSRSAAIQRAIRMLQDPELEDAYAAAWEEWQASGEATAGESRSCRSPATSPAGSPLIRWPSWTMPSASTSSSGD